MSLSSASTNTEVKAAYDDNCGYDLDDDVTKCKEFIRACRILVRRMAEEIRTGNSSVSDTYKKIQDELKKAESWWTANDTAAATSTAESLVRGFGFEDFRT